MTTLAQIGGLTLMSVSGGRWAEITNHYGEPVGVILPCGENRAVEVVLNWADLYDIRRIRLVVSGSKRGEVVVEQEHTDVYCDGLYDLVYTTACWK